MKTTISKLIGIVMLIIGMAGIANASSYKPLGGIMYSFKVATGEKVATLVLENMDGKPVMFMLTNENKQVAMYRKFEDMQSTTANIDFSALIPGRYTMTLQFEANRVLRILEVTKKQTVVMKDYLMDSTEMPYNLRLHEDTLLLMFSDASEEVLDIHITDNDGETIFLDKFIKGFKPVKKFDLSRLEEGIYFIEIKGEDTKIVETIAL